MFLLAAVTAGPSEPTLPPKDDTEKEKDTLSWSSIGGHAWQRLKLNFNSAKTMATEKKRPDKKRQWEGTFVRGMSAFQLFLGFSYIVIALVGLAAAFDAKQIMTRNSMDDLKYQMRDFYRRLVDNVTTAAKNDRNALMEYYRNEMKRMKLNVTNEYSSYSYDYPPQSKLPEYRLWDFPDYCPDKRYDLCHGYGNDRRVKELRLIMDYLCVPAWTGMMYIITGLVGLRMMASKKPMEYSQVSHSYTLLNFLCAALFAPGMIAVGILQGHFSDELFLTFRTTVGKITIGFAGVGLFLSLALCIVGCCCPISPRLHDNHYKELSESTDTLPEEKQEEEKDKMIVA